VTSRRGAAEWAKPRSRVTPLVDVLIPTAGRGAELAVTLAGLAAQDDPPFDVQVSDQSLPGPVAEVPAVAALARVLRVQGREVRFLRHLPRRGLAEQRHYLLGESTADQVLYLDDDVWLEPGMLARLHNALRTLGCGFVGAALQGLSYLDDERPAEQEPFEVWDGPVRPETIRRDSPEFARWTLHNAANVSRLNAAADAASAGWVPYKIAWVGGCVLFRREALVATGGFDFWDRLPADHVGEDVVAQWRVMGAFGGAGILPSGAVHLEAPTTLPGRGVEASEVVFAPRDTPV